MKKRDFTEEIAFWDNTLAPNNRHPWMKLVLNPETRKDKFPPFFLDYITKIKERSKCQRVKVLDIGAGPLSPLGWGVDQNLFDLVAIDPLAEEYSKILNKYNISFPVKPIECSGEELTTIFDENSFDIVYCRNALDHMDNPKLVINNIFTVLVNGGYFYLDSFNKEGTHEKWSGLHQHDLFIKKGKLIHSDKRGNKTNLTSNLKFVCVYQWQAGVNPGEWFKIIFQKESIIKG